MNFKSLLLGSAAAIVLASGAQAADLTVAEPVDYVKVCDAFGAGFFYSPGTDTCIKVGGYVEFGTSFGDNDFGSFNRLYKDSNWGNFYTEVSIQLTASSVTEYGNLTGFIDMRAKTGNKAGETGTFSDLVNESTNSAYVDSAYLELGPIKAGYFTSLFDFGRGYDDTGMFGSDSTVDHIQLTYAVNGFGLSLSVEDQRDRNAFGYGLLDGVERGNDNIPDVVAAVTYSSGIFSAKVAGAYVNQAYDWDNYDSKVGWAIGGGLEVALDNISAGDRFFVSASYGDNANSFTGISGGTSVAGTVGFDNEGSSFAGSSWSALASYKHVWTPQLWSSLSGGYASYEGSDNLDGAKIDAWRVGFNTAYAPVKGLQLVADVFYTDVDAKGFANSQSGSDVGGIDGDGSSWTANLFLQRSW